MFFKNLGYESGIHWCERRSFKAQNHHYSAKAMLSGKNKLREYDLKDKNKLHTSKRGFLDKIFTCLEYNVD